MKKDRIWYVLFLIIGFCGQVIPDLFQISRGSGLLTVIWIYAFLELVCRFHTKTGLILTGIVFVAGYCIKFVGALGILWAELVMFSIVGLALYAAFLASAYFMRRWNNPFTTVALPLFWAVEYLLATILRAPLFVRFDMMLTDMSAFIYIERFVGVFGFSFAVLWLISLLRYAVSNRKILYMALCVALFLGMVTPGVINMYQNTTTFETVRVAYTTGPYGGDFMNYVAPDSKTNSESMTRSVRSAASEGAGILVFNEEAFELDDTEEEGFVGLCASLAEENSIAVLLGLDVRDTDGSEGGMSDNKIVLIDADGRIVNSYQKSKLIPIIESGYVSGDGKIPSDRIVLNGKSVKISYLICYDSNFPGYVGQMEPDTDILFLPSWDWGAITELHAKLCRTIAVENDVYILKPTYDGISVAIDPDGHIFHSSSPNEIGYETVQTVDMPLRSTIVQAEKSAELSPFIHAIIGTDIFSVFVCLTLLVGTISLGSGSYKNTKRGLVFNVMLVTNIVACGADALSWLLDGHTRLDSVVYWSTFIAMLLTITLIWEFVFYLFVYINEKEKVPAVWLTVSNCISLAASIATVVMSLTGSLYTVTDAVYADGPLYGIYVIINIGMLIFAVVSVSVFRRSLTYSGRIAAYGYAVIPALSAAVNLFIEDWSFAYPATALTLLLIFVMIQSDEIVRLEHKGKIVNYHLTHDELTGLYNRYAFENRRTHIKETEGNCGVVFGDLNGLKYVNDNFGHASGDKLLAHFAAMLTEVFRMNEVFRISGDEFVCIMEYIDEKVFRQRLKELEVLIGIDSQPIASIGAYFGNNRDVDALIKEAEKRMYAEKEDFHKRFPDLRR